MRRSFDAAAPGSPGAERTGNAIVSTTRTATTDESTLVPRHYDVLASINQTRVWAQRFGAVGCLPMEYGGLHGSALLIK